MKIQPLFTWPRPMSERDFQMREAAAERRGAIFGTEKVEYTFLRHREIEMKSGSKTRLFS